MENNKFFPLPLFQSPTAGRFKFPIYFNGSHVYTNDKIAIINLHNNGFFGTTVLKNKSNEIPIMEDNISDGEENDDCKELHMTEHLFLLPEECLFLMKLNCIQLTDANHSLLDTNQAWQAFNHINNFLLQNFIVYHYYRSKNWIIKAGLKFGGDYLLYKESPEVCHSSYVVIIDVAQGMLQNIDKFKVRRSMTISQILGTMRLAEAAGKEVLISQICWSQNKILNVIDLDNPNCIQNFEIQEHVLHRMQNKVEIK